MRNFFTIVKTNYLDDRVEELNHPGTSKGGFDAYNSIGFCVIDSLQSIGISYNKHVLPLLNRLACKFNIDQFSNCLTVTDFIKLMPNLVATNRIFTRHRTSSRNGILKSEAMMRFFDVLREHGVETKKDIVDMVNVFNNDILLAEYLYCVKTGWEYDRFIQNNFKDTNVPAIILLIEDLTKIPGQNKHVSIAYFLMLCGVRTVYKFDRVIYDFFKKHRNMSSPNPLAVYEDLIAIKKSIASDYPILNLREIDSAIWRAKSNW